jgi:hypothetical protein
MLGLSLVNFVALVLLVSVLAILCRYQRKRARMVSLINRIPGPPSLPLIGNAIELNVEHDGMLTVSALAEYPYVKSGDGGGRIKAYRRKQFTN